MNINIEVTTERVTKMFTCDVRDKDVKLCLLENAPIGRPVPLDFGKYVHHFGWDYVVERSNVLEICKEKYPEYMI